MERVASEVNRAVQRLVTERLASVRAAENLLRNEMRGQVTAILLNSELALRKGQLPASAVTKMKQGTTLRNRCGLRWTAGRRLRAT